MSLAINGITFVSIIRACAYFKAKAAMDEVRASEAKKAANDAEIRRLSAEVDIPKNKWARVEAAIQNRIALDEVS